MSFADGDGDARDHLAHAKPLPVSIGVVPGEGTVRAGDLMPRAISDILNGSNSVPTSH